MFELKLQRWIQGEEAYDSFGGGSKMERRLVMCSSYSFRGGSKMERRAFYG